MQAIDYAMPVQTLSRTTIGFICTWPVYQGTTIDRYAHSLIQGISAAANEYGCNLLLGCGFSATGNSPQYRSFWPVPGPDINFVPVGPWNADPASPNNWENQALFDFEHRALPALSVFNTP